MFNFVVLRDRHFLLGGKLKLIKSFAFPTLFLPIPPFLPPYRGQNSRIQPSKGKWLLIRFLLTCRSWLWYSWLSNMKKNDEIMGYRFLLSCVRLVKYWHLHFEFMPNVVILTLRDRKRVKMKLKLLKISKSASNA